VPPPKGRGAAWGGLARRAAGTGGTAATAEPVSGRLAGAGRSGAADAFAAAAGRDAEPEERVEVRVELVEADGVRGAARKAVRRGGAVPVPEAQGGRRRKPPPKALVEELEPVAGSGAPKIAARLADASRAFEAERFPEAQRILAPLARRAPSSAAVRELHGLALYRLGRWEAATKELEAFRELTGSTEQHPVLADSYRALRRYDAVEALWEELREASPSAELVAEGRIVFAGSLADRGDLARAIATVEPSVRRIKAPRQFHHLRLLYVLGDLYERAGDVPRARAQFDRVLAADPDFGDARSRRRQL
jgi:tetratricopeptide (TPR) repeat protein